MAHLTSLIEKRLAALIHGSEIRYLFLAELGAPRHSPNFLLLPAQMADKFYRQWTQKGLHDRGKYASDFRPVPPLVGCLPPYPQNHQSRQRGFYSSSNKTENKLSNPWNESNTSNMGVVHMCQDRVCEIDKNSVNLLMMCWGQASYLQHVWTLQKWRWLVQNSFMLASQVRSSECP